jgi:autotransporter-associated beta strand protein
LISSSRDIVLGGSGSIVGWGGLTKSGTGALTIATSNTYTGPTMLNAGKLVMDGSVVSPVTVNSGGILSGTGYLSSVSVSQSGQIAPGNAPQRLTISGSLSLASSAVMDYELDTPLTSGLLSCGTLVLTGQLEFSNFDFTWTSNFGPGTYNLIEAGSLPNGILGGDNSGSIDGYPANLALSGNEVVLKVVPEPSALSLLIVGSAGLLAFAWRRNLRNRTDS